MLFLMVLNCCFIVLDLYLIDSDCLNCGISQEVGGICFKYYEYGLNKGIC